GLLAEDPEDAAEREYRYKKMLADNEKIKLSEGFADRMAKYQRTDGDYLPFADRFKQKMGGA
ncbi:hypothetical protein LDC_2457, partial [sediment metagenome]